MRKAGLDEAQTAIKIAGWNTNNLRYTDDTTLVEEREERTKEYLDESERGEWKSWIKTQRSENEDHSIQSHHFMANRRGNNRNSGSLFLGAPKSLQMVTAAMKLRHLLLEEKLWST